MTITITLVQKLVHFHFAICFFQFGQFPQCRIGPNITFPWSISLSLIQIQGGNETENLIIGPSFFTVKTLGSVVSTLQMRDLL